jgi:pimeloyl-ACP methyl ester carboxylesterase
MTQDGPATPLLLVHGLAGSPRWWRHVDAGDRPIRAVDARRAAPELDEPAVVVGHSLGGLQAAQLAAARPELVRALVLVAPVGVRRAGPAYAVGLAATLAEAPPSLLATVVGDALRWGPRALLRGSWHAARTVFAGEIRAPTLLVWGRRDRLVPPALAETWREAIPGARLVVLDRAGHVPMLETPAPFNEALREFLDDVGV